MTEVCGSTVLIRDPSGNSQEIYLDSLITTQEWQEVERETESVEVGGFTYKLATKSVFLMPNGSTVTLNFDNDLES